MKKKFKQSLDFFLSINITKKSPEILIAGLVTGLALWLVHLILN